MKHSCVLLLFLASSVVAAAAPVPQDPGAGLKEMSLEQLANLEVTTASKRPEQVWQSPAAIYVLTQEDIRRSGATTLPELLRLVPGVQVSQLDSDHWAVGVRGLTSAFSKSLLVLIDGRSIYTPLFGGVFWQAHDTLFEDIERIEVIRGPGGTIWGANAVNGVINVITRNSRDSIGTYASATTGTIDQGILAARHGGTIGDDTHYRVYGKWSTRNAEFAPDDHPFDHWRIGQVGFRIDAAPRAGDAVFVEGDIYKGSAGERLGVGSFTPPSQVILEGSDQISGGNLVTRWERDLGGGAGFRLQAYFDRTNRRAIHFGESRNTFDADFVHHTPVSSRHSVSWGAGVRSSPSDFTQVVPTLDLSPQDRTYRILSAFAQDEVTLVNDSLWLTAGAKLEHNSYTGLEVQPSVRLLWRRSARESWWTSVARAVRTPSRIDVDLRLTQFALADPPAYILVAGSEELQSESLIGVEAGYRRLIGSQIYVDVAAFHDNYNRLTSLGTFDVSVDLNPIPHLLFAIPWVNGIAGTTDGFEIAPEWRPASWWRLRGAYSFLTVNMRDRPGFTDPSNVRLYEGSSPRHQLFVQSSLTLPRRFELDQALRFASALPARGNDRYTTADARFGWQVSDRVSLSIAGRNLLQPHHPEFSRDEIPSIGIERSVSADITWRH